MWLINSKGMMFGGRINLIDFICLLAGIWFILPLFYFIFKVTRPIPPPPPKRMLQTVYDREKKAWGLEEEELRQELRAHQEELTQLQERLRDIKTDEPRFFRLNLPEFK